MVPFAALPVLALSFSSSVSASPLRRCGESVCARSDSSSNNNSTTLIIIGAVVGSLLLITVIAVFVTKHWKRRPNFADAASRRREFERRRQSDSAASLIGGSSYASLGMADDSEPKAPSSPPSSGDLPEIKVYAASQRTMSTMRYTVKPLSPTSDQTHEVVFQTNDDDGDDEDEEDKAPMLSSTKRSPPQTLAEYDKHPPTYAIADSDDE